MAFIVGLGALFFLGALMVQVRAPDDAGNPGWTRFADGSEVIVAAHVTKEGTLQEDAFINRPTRADFQRSGTYPVLVVSGMNVSILALVTFWFLRR